MKSTKTQKPSNTASSSVVARNIDAINKIEEDAHARRTRSDIVSDIIADFCGSTLFVYVHCVLFIVWLFWNGTSVIPEPWKIDKPPFNLLTLVVSLEAIFLSTFILISQNRQQRTADHRNHLDLQINLLAEQESSRLLSMTKKIMTHLGIHEDDEEEAALEQMTNPEELAETIRERLQVEKPPTAKKLGENKHDS